MTRTRTIYELEISEQFGNLLLLRVLCEAGTYIRKLVYDIGEVIAVGGTMAELRAKQGLSVWTKATLSGCTILHEANEIYKESQNEKNLRGLVRPIETAITFPSTGQDTGLGG